MAKRGPKVTGPPTFYIVQLRIQSEADLRCTDVHKLILVVFDTSELADYFAQDVVLAWADAWYICGNEVMYGEDVCHLDVEGRFSTCVEVIKLIDIEVCLGIRDPDYCS